MARYIIQGGVAGKKRLELLSRALWPTTSALLADAGVAPGMRVLDLGCGGGDVTLEIARIVGPSGAVVGLDMDERKLALAREAAAERGLRNVDFRIARAEEWAEESCYDAVYSRFLLTHLADPLAMLRKMRHALCPGAIGVVEDIDFSGYVSYPPNPGLDAYVRLYRAAAAHQGADADIGPKLYRMFVDTDWRDVRVRAVQPIFVSGESKQASLLTLTTIADGLIEEGLATEPEVRTAIEQLREYRDDPTTLISMPRLFQVWGRRE